MADGRGVFIVFLASFLARVFIDVLFHLRFGLHAAGRIEVWLYTGVAEGIMLTGHGLSDPTVWFLRAVGLLTPGHEFYGVILAGALLSSITACLILLLAGELYGKRAGFAAGLIYGGMIEPLGLSVSGFTHDLMQLPLMVLVIYLAVKALRSQGWAKAAYVALAAVAVYDGIIINSNMWVAVAVAAAYSIFALAGLEGRPKSYVAYLVIVLAVVLCGRLFLGGYVERILEALPQGRMGSSDVIPLSAPVFWLSYNVLLFLLPYGIFAAYLRRDIVSLGLFSSGLALATIMSRGSRISDLGLAMLASLAITEWENKAKAPAVFSRKNRLSTVAVYSCAVFLCGAPFVDVGVAQLAVFASGGFALILCLQRLKGDRLIVAASSAIFLVGAASTLVYIFTASGFNVAPEAEYQLLKSVVGQDGRILVPWDHGYMAEAVSGLEAVSTPGRIERNVHDLLWLPEHEAAAKLKEANVKYLLFNGDNYNTGAGGYAVRGGFVWLPDRPLSPDKVGEYAIQRLRYGNVTDFTLISRVWDQPAEMEYFLYEVTPR